MKLQLHRTIVLSACLIACPMLMISQEPSAGAPKAAPTAAESLVKDLASQARAWEQSCRQLAAIYREMAVPSESDSPSARELKLQYQRLAENQDRAAAAAGKMASYHTQLAGLTERPPVAPSPRNVYADSAFKR
jgi:hypothetical protein